MTTPWFGLHLPNYTFPGTPPERLFDRVVEQARAAEAAGFGLVTVMDHLNQIPGIGPQTDPMLEAWSVLSALARETGRVRLGTLVTGVTYRNPALLAKTATTLDVISGGRAVFGLGAAWYDAEHRAFGFDFPPIGERMDRLDEALAIAKAMFTEDRPSFAGRYYRIDLAINVPRPVQPGGPRILVGGGGEQRTLKIAARHADMTHWFPLGLETLAHKTEVLARHCEAIGRDPSTVERTMAAPVIVGATEADARAAWERLPEERRSTTSPATPERAADAFRPYLDAGFTGFTFNNNVYATPERIAVLGELLRLIGG
jgi:F420-dependent oxidoreductase-like protein